MQRVQRRRLKLLRRVTALHRCRWAAVDAACDAAERGRDPQLTPFRLCDAPAAALLRSQGAPGKVAPRPLSAEVQLEVRAATHALYAAACRRALP